MPRELTSDVLDRLHAASQAAGGPVGAPDLSDVDVPDAGPWGTVSGEALVWWNWRNKVAAGQEAIGPHIYLYALDEAIAKYEEMRAVAADFARNEPVSPDDMWGPTWMPIVGRSDATVIAADVASKLSPVHAVRWEFGLSEPAVCESIGDLAMLWTETIESGRWVFVDGSWVRSEPEFPAELRRYALVL